MYFLAAFLPVNELLGHTMGDAMTAQWNIPLHQSDVYETNSAEGVIRIIGDPSEWEVHSMMSLSVRIGRRS